MSAYQPVLDPACGGRMFWFDKSDDRVLFGDVRDESWELCDGRRFDVKPDMLMDYRDLPFPDGTFRMVTLDPAPDIVEIAEALDAMAKPHVGSGWANTNYTDLPCTTPRQEAIWMAYNGITRGD